MITSILIGSPVLCLLGLAIAVGLFFLYKKVSQYREQKAVEAGEAKWNRLTEWQQDELVRLEEERNDMLYRIWNKK